ncbi:MAG: hypothetical protein ACI4KA_00840 [Oscillospiraceae bacterium]
MDKVVAFFKNVWFKRAVALLCTSYTALLVWVAWLYFAYFVEYENPTALFVLYLFVNCAALGLMVYTRHQVFTMINVMLIPLVVFLITIFGYGNLYLILPPVCVMVAMFFICSANETLKTVVGTMYLLMFVIGIAGYLAVDMLMGPITFIGVELELRDTEYELPSPSEEYRIVRYIDEPKGDRRIVKYYIESTEDDKDIPFGFAKKVLGCKQVLAQQYTGKSDSPIQWIETKVDGEEVEMLSVEGSLRENPYLAKPVQDSETGEALTPVSLFSKGEETAETSDAAETAPASQTAEDTAEAA